MFFEQHALEPNIGAAYFWLSLVRGGRDLQTYALEDWMERGYAALQVMENHLKTHEYFAAGQLTVADIALYGYTHVADRCDYDLATFPAVRAWLRRVEQAAGFVGMDWRPEDGAEARRRGLNHRQIAGITAGSAAILPFSTLCRRNIARDALDILPDVAGDLPAQSKDPGHDTVARRQQALKLSCACSLVQTGRRCRGLACDRLAVAVPDRHPHGVFDQGQHGDADTGVADSRFSSAELPPICDRQGAGVRRAIRSR